MESLGNSHQIVCAIYDARVEEAIDWLKNDLIGFHFEETDEVIVHIDHFQFLTFSGSPYCHCVATCTLHHAIDREEPGA